MAKIKKDKVLTVHTTTTESGKETKTTQKILIAQEPDYIKLYLNTLLVFKDLPKQMNAALFELLKLTSFADPAAKHGGQLIGLTTFIKQDITNRLGIKMNTLNKALTAFVKRGILRRVGGSTYQANPEMFGRGQWIDIKAIRATFDFNAGTVNADIDRPETRSFLERAAAGQIETDKEEEENDE